MGKRFLILPVLWGFTSLALAGPAEKFTAAEDSFKAAMDKVLQQHFDKGLTKEDLYRAATAGMLESLNSGDRAWNKLLSPGDLRDLQSDLSGKVAGIGLELKFDQATGMARVLNVLPGSPSAKSGLKLEDQILSVNGRRYKGLTLGDLVADIRGKIGESVSLKVLREDKVVSFDVRRDVIPWTPVDLSKVDETTQVLTIGYFTAETRKLVEQKIAEINAGAARNLIVDVRGNSGGAFDPAVETAELFVPRGKTIVATKDRDGKLQAIVSKKGILRAGLKIIVLTDGETSSGAEFFTGALVDELGAKTVGSKTFGKWNVQTVETLPNGFGIKFTTLAFQTPAGKTYANVGLKPDVEVAMTTDAGPRELRAKYGMAKRLELDQPLKAAAELVRAM